ncbi:type II secretion system protein GspM [Xanthomonas translucens]|uniref:type II secretion system protein GspM n=1 Tax=Xanthomonas campestris pv. translucens TaxID=343 RepID=UPI0002A7980E|nr:type II secretion system protein GspM [Xanthomonas translucens]AKK68925.1 general secretion pathway protein GspM [Xanthomonas translucens pv. undulosa]ELQ15063.1 general secretion pathway protein m [Xanthomonas translucens DAR61454]MBC3973258.1 type II secretion system protein M [Xanthomonas translucens pv. undulosa]MCT8269124.1 type II secretion system protein GspM [Xanthomonas translucens pv. undulosa]MCT8280559.1 type II secretion system protein GspM [Xanthomonas translucens pv. undulosa
MPVQVDKRDRWLALGLLLAALALAYLLLVHPWWTVPMREVETQIQELRQRELRVRMQLQQAPQVAQRLQQAQRALATRPGFLRETSAELASAGLVQRLESAVATASPGNRSCAISNRSPLAADNRRDRFTRVAVQVRLRCGTPELAAVLHALESGSPALFVDNLNVMAQRYQLSPGESGNGLDVAFELAGYLRPNAMPAPPAAAGMPSSGDAPALDAGTPAGSGPSDPAATQAPPAMPDAAAQPPQQVEGAHAN